MAQRSTDAGRLERLYRRYAERDARTFGSPVYAAICAGLADDPARGSLALAAPPGFRIPNALLSAVHRLLLSGVRDPLASYYPTVAGDAARSVDEGLYPAFAAFVDRHDDALRELIATHATQTNEVGRSALVLPALALAAGAEPLAIVEIGSSGGLNQLLDRFRYRIGDATVGDPTSPVDVACEVRGELLPPVPDPLPAIAWRAGIDRSPIDVTRQEAADWLRAQVWPEHRDRMATLEAAISLARSIRPRVVRGEAVEGIGALAREAPAEARLVVVSTSVLVYLEPARRRLLVDELRSIAAERAQGAWLVTCEPEDVLADLELDVGRSGVDLPELNALASCHVRPDGSLDARLLALCHPHGRWMRWLDPATARRA